MGQNTFTLEHALLLVTLTGSRDREQAQELGEEGGLLGVEILMFQDQGKQRLVHQKLQGSAQMETLHYLKRV